MQRLLRVPWFSVLADLAGLLVALVGFTTVWFLSADLNTWLRFSAFVGGNTLATITGVRLSRFLISWRARKRGRQHH